jgi:hypothetical protein
MAREKFRGVRWPVSSAVGIGRVLTPIRGKNPDTEPRVSRHKVKGKTCLSTAVLVRYVRLPGTWVRGDAPRVGGGGFSTHRATSVATRLGGS